MVKFCHLTPPPSLVNIHYLSDRGQLAYISQKFRSAPLRLGNC